MRVTILLLLSLIILTTAEPPQIAQQHEAQLARLRKFLADQFDSGVGLVRESPDKTINRTYWLLSDNLLAVHVLNGTYPEIAAQISASLRKYGIFKDGLHEALFSGVIQLPPYTPLVRTVENTSIVVKVEERGNETGDLQNDWTQYADLLLYAALSRYNEQYDSEALYYLSRASGFWNEAGLWDKPTQLDGFYTTHKLALLMYAADVLNQTLPFRALLEDRIWMFQREDGGIRSHYLGNLTSNREANSETAGLVLLAYQYAQQKTERNNAIMQELENRRIFEQSVMIAAAGAAIVVALVSFLLRKRRKEK